MTELKRCPFCGGHGSLTDDYRTDSVVVVCEVCKAFGPAGEDEEDAATLWNRAGCIKLWNQRAKRLKNEFVTP